MPWTINAPSYIFSGPTVSLLDHLRLVQDEIRTIQLDTGTGAGTLGPEPDRIMTDWRDDGLEDGDHSGWVSVIHWPAEVKK